MAPDWLIKRMEELAKLPSPSIEKIIKQWEASDEFRWKYLSIEYRKNLPKIIR